MSLQFFNQLSGSLHIQLSQPAEPIAEGLVNLKAPPAATIESLSLQMSVFEDDDLRDLTAEEWDRVVLEAPTITLRSLGEPVTHAAPNGRHFTVRALVAAVEETERRTRHQSEWFEGIDVHHCFFEGIRKSRDGVWSIRWGS
jgi:hypothetical protein